MPVSNVYQSANSSTPIQVRKRPAMGAQAIKEQPSKYSSIVVPPAPKLDFSTITPISDTKPTPIAPAVSQPIKSPSIPSFASISKPVINPVSPMKPEAQMVQPQTQAVASQGLPATGVSDTMSLSDKMDKIGELSDKELQQVQEAKDNGYSQDDIVNHLYDMRFGQKDIQPNGYKGLISDQIGKGLDSQEIALNPIGAGFTVLDNVIQSIPVSDSSKDGNISGSDRVKDFAINLIPSIGKLASSAGNAITNPGDTAKAIGTLAFTEDGRDAFMNYIKSNYGSTQGFSDYVRKDPAGVISDIAGLISGGSTIAGKTAGVIGKLGEIGKVADVAKIADTAGDIGRVSKLAKFQNTMSKVASVADTIGNAGIDIPIKGLSNKGLGLADNLIAGESKIGKIAGYATKGAINAATNPLANAGAIKDYGMSKAGNSLDFIKEKTSGLDKETVKGIQSNPYQADYWNEAKSVIDSTGLPQDTQQLIRDPIKKVGTDLLQKISEQEKNFSESGPLYNDIRKLNTPVDLTPAKTSISDILNKYDIKVKPDGKLDFNSSKFIKGGDLSAIQDVFDRVNGNSQTTPGGILNLRQSIDSAAKRDGGKPSDSQGIIKEIRSAVDNTAKDQVPGLKDTDALYSKQLKEIKDLKDGLFYKGGDKIGQLRDNFSQIIKTIGGQNRAQMMTRLSEVMPDLQDRIDAINNIPKIAKAYSSVPTGGDILRSSLVGGLGYNIGGVHGAIVGGLVGYFGDKILAGVRKSTLDKIVSEISPDAKSKLETINSKIENKQSLSTQDKLQLNSIKQKLQAEINKQDKVDKPALKPKLPK